MLIARLVLPVSFLFFVKLKTGYEMRISDWSSDVSSADVDADELVAGLGNDLLARERRAAALDQALARVTLVGAVDVEREAAGVVELDHVVAVAAQACGSLFGTRNRSLDPVPDARHGVDEPGHRGAGADADDHPVLYECDGFFGGKSFGFGHGVRDWGSRVTAVPCLPAPAAASTAPRSPEAPTGASPCGSGRSLHPARLHCRGSFSAGSGLRVCARNRTRQEIGRASCWERG